ncbi:MAG: LacI family DNA-binding transcriptional regulator [Candidatus Pelethousia sp.]|nr:LacI family DNA-binding transcriptional regulator [Candidatus Pelethousia sp.]
MNIKDIAVLAETSTATVSRVINGDAHVSADMRKKVLEVIELTGYKPNLVGKALRSQRSNKLLVLLPTIVNPYYSRVLQGVEQCASIHDYDTVIAITHRDPETERRYLSLASTKQVDGVVTFTSSLSDEDIYAYSKEFPIVQCGASSGLISCSCIDNVKASYDATEFLIRLGNRRIGLLNGPYRRTYEVDRENGYRYALIDYGIPVIPEYIASCDYTFTDGIDCCAELMQLPEPPTAIFTSYDISAAGAIKQLLKLGLTPGRDVDVIGFDGTYISAMYSPEITTVEQPGYELGKAAFDLLLEKIEKPDAMVKKIIMPHKLIIRESTRSMPAEDVPPIESSRVTESAG